MMEYTALRAWVKQRLTYFYLRWYHLSAWSPDMSLQDFFEAPVVNRKWNTESTDPTLVRFGLLWKVYDWLADKGLDYKVPILDTTPSLNCVKVCVGRDRRTGLSTIRYRGRPASGEEGLCLKKIGNAIKHPTSNTTKPPSSSWITQSKGSQLD
jgi:hypothetical protein